MRLQLRYHGAQTTLLTCSSLVAEDFWIWFEVEFPSHRSVFSAFSEEQKRELCDPWEKIQKQN